MPFTDSELEEIRKRAQLALEHADNMATAAGDWKVRAQAGLGLAVLYAAAVNKPKS